MIFDSGGPPGGRWRDHSPRPVVARFARLAVGGGLANGNFDMATPTVFHSVSRPARFSFRDDGYGERLGAPTMRNYVPRSLITLALWGAVALAFAPPGLADDQHNSHKSGAHDSKHAGGKSAGGKSLLSKGDKGVGGALGRVDGAIAVGVLGLGVLNAITNANGPPQQ